MLLDQLRSAVCTRHYGRRIEAACVGRVRQFIVYQGKRHPSDLGSSDVAAFVSSLAARGVSASTQHQALTIPPVSL